MQKILISACLLGQKVRYDGKGKKQDHLLIEQWLDEGRLVPACPEMLGGLPVPRPAAEYQKDGRIVTQSGTDVTAQFRLGANKALSLLKKHKIKLAILKENSPSCGVHFIYDGSFLGKKRSGQGVATMVLKAHGVEVFSEKEIDQASEYLNKIA